jgi:hypothetical protein
MATTTNYGWETPDDTDLVKDGASAIRTLGSSIDTTTKALNPETTLGDISYRSSTANTKTRLALGTAGQVLTVNSGATAPEWKSVSADSMTLLSTTTLSGASVNITGISQDYKDLHLIIDGVTNATANGNLYMKVNGSNSSFIMTGVYGYSTPNTNFYTTTAYINNDSNVILRTSANNTWQVRINNYTQATNYKPMNCYGFYFNSVSDNIAINLAGSYYSNSAVTSILFLNTGGNLSTGTVKIYGVK